jgi:hypothetical protein
MERSQLVDRGNERLGSPININNYINIYTGKNPQPSPPPLQNFAPKKTLSYGNSSFEKSINNSSIRQQQPINHSYGSAGSV